MAVKQQMTSCGVDAEIIDFLLAKGVTSQQHFAKWVKTAQSLGTQGRHTSSMMLDRDAIRVHRLRRRYGLRPSDCACRLRLGWSGRPLVSRPLLFRTYQSLMLIDKIENMK